jgi:hypothetical protein
MFRVDDDNGFTVTPPDGGADYTVNPEQFVVM